MIAPLPERVFRSHDYVKNEIQSPWKAMLLNNVLAGVEYTTMLNSPYLKGPPQGYDSVCILLFPYLPKGLTGLHKQVYGKPGQDLKYDELVVYTNHAIRPAYLVMYE